MNRRMDSVRSRYAYICGASALLSAALLFVMARTFEFIYRHVLVGDGSLSRIVHWVINHIGRTPFLFVGGAVLFMLFFWIRSQKVSADLEQIARGTHDMAHGRMPGTIEVMSGGELRQIAADLNEVAYRLQEERGAFRAEDTSPIEHGDAVAGARLATNVPVQLTLYGIRSSLTEVLEGRCRDEAEIQHWVRLAYEQTVLLQHALEDPELQGANDMARERSLHRDTEC